MPTGRFRDIAADIERRLRSEEWQPGERLPKYREFAVQYDVALTTIQKAIALVPPGLIVHAPGKAMYRAGAVISQATPDG